MGLNYDPSNICYLKSLKLKRNKNMNDQYQSNKLDPSLPIRKKNKRSINKMTN